MKDITSRLKSAGLRVTPQRLAVLEVLDRAEGHPTAENIAEKVHAKHPSIALGTVYNILESFVRAGITSHVKTSKGKMIYETITDKHHHLYCAESDRIEDYYDDDLDKILENYFKKKKLEHFKLEDIKLQLVGRFTEDHSK